ncbi:MAG TPA: zinc-finger domain-containing protein [Bauldia sp.]|nr:zinc-finger domain-containing protein [Bauldia sp.]
MADHIVPHYQNSTGDRAITIGVKEFMCIGAEPPFDHPHIFIDMGDEDEKVCPYCSTLYRYRSGMPAEQTEPPGHLWRERVTA